MVEPATGEAGCSDRPAPAITVVLPCYNAHRDLPRALDSVRAQTCQDFEIIIVDDGSTDPETIAFLNELPADVRLIRQENRGLPGARNTGFKHARGRWVLPLDCDDWIDPRFLSVARTLIETAPYPAFVFAHLRMFGEARGVLKKHFNRFEQLFFNQLPYCMLIPRRLWDEVGGYDETMREGYEDWEFNIRLAEYGATGHVVEEPLFNYNVSASGMLGSRSRRQHARLWRSIRERHPESYRQPVLWRMWREWRLRPATRPLAIYFVWNLLYLALPEKWVSTIVRFFFILSHSSRTALARNDNDGPAIKGIGAGTYGNSGALAAGPPASNFSAWILARIGVVGALVPAVLSRSASYLILVISAWTLSPDEFGVFAALWVVGGIVGAAVSGGGDMWLNRFSTPQLSREMQLPQVWRLYLTMCITMAVSGIGIAFLAILVSPDIARYDVAVLFAILAFCMMGLGEAVLALVRATGRITMFFVLRDLAAPLSFLLSVLLILPDRAATIFVLHGIVWLTICAGLTFWLLQVQRPSQPQVSRRRQLRLLTLRHTALMLVSNLSSRGLAYIDVLMMTGTVSLAALGEYRVAAQVAIGFTVVQHFVFLALPWQLRTAHSEDACRVARFRADTKQRGLILLSGIALLLGLLLADQLFSLFGERFVESTNVLRWLLLIRFSELLWGPQHEVLISNGQIRDDATANISGIVAWLVAYFVLSPLLEPITSAICAVAVGATTAQALRAHAIARHRLYCPRLLA